MSPKPKTSRRKRLIILSALGLTLLALVPLPVGINAGDRESAVSHAIAAVMRKRLVMTDKGYDYLEDTSFVKDKSRVYFRNDLGIPDTVFTEHGLKPIPQDRKLDVDKGDVIISFSNRDIKDKAVANIQFSYVFGSLGAQGYEIRIHKSLLMRYFVYVHVWVS